MTEHPHLEAIKTRHREIDETVKAEQRRPGSDALKVTNLKKDKLKLKDEIEKFRN